MSDCICKNQQNQGNVRNELDQIDREIMELLVRRMELSASMAEAKKNTSLPLFDYAREQDILKKLPSCCCQTSLEKQSRICSAGIRVYEEILRQSRRIQAKTLLPKSIYLIGASEREKQQIGKQLSDILGFTYINTRNELLMLDEDLLEEDIEIMLQQLSSQKELIVNCDAALFSNDTVQEFLHNSGCCIFLDRCVSSTKSCTDTSVYRHTASASICTHGKSPLEIAQEIIVFLRK